MKERLEVFLKPWKARRGVKSVTWIKDAVKDKEREREKESKANFSSSDLGSSRVRKILPMSPRGNCQYCFPRCQGNMIDR